MHTLLSVVASARDEVFGKGEISGTTGKSGLIGSEGVSNPGAIGAVGGTRALSSLGPDCRGFAASSVVVL